MTLSDNIKSKNLSTVYTWVNNKSQVTKYGLKSSGGS